MTTNESAALSPRWPLPVALLTVWLFPATTARRTARISLLRVWFFHFITGLMGALTILVLICILDARTAKVPAIRDNLVQAVSGMVNGGWSSVFISIGVFLAVEAWFLAVALLFMPWGARDENVRQSYWNSLRCGWLRTGHLPFLVLFIAVFAHFLNRARDHCIQDIMARPTVVKVFFSAEDPWYVRDRIPLIITAMVSGVGWFLFGWLRAAGADRLIPPVVRPPMCEFCGYNLTFMAMVARCPECGENIIHSLGPDVRLGPTWERRSGIGVLNACRRTTSDALVRPLAFGRIIPIAARTTEDRRFMALHLPLIFLAGAACTISAAIVAEGVNEVFEDPLIPILMGSLSGMVCMIGTVAAINLVALVVGAMETRRMRRNLFPAAMRAARYSIGFLVLWAMLGGGMGVAWVAAGTARWFEILQELSGVPRDVIAAWSWGLPNLTIGILYCVLVARITSGMRFANK